jgi:tRNA U54 and U55 pseudouridine synthase Pus10
VQVALRVWRLPVYIGGRYLKRERHVSQSPWVIDGQRRCEASVQEEIAAVVIPALKCDSYKFITAGAAAGTGRGSSTRTCFPCNEPEEALWS